LEAGKLTAARVIAAMVTLGAASRKELEAALALGKASISRTVDRLIRKQYVTEGPKVASSRGRKAASLRLKPGLAYLVGTDLEGLAVRGCVMDCSRRIVAAARREIGPRWSVGRILKSWSELLEELIAKSGVPKHKIAGVGVGLPGVVASDGLHSRAYLPPGRWVELDAGRVLAGLGLPATGANNVLCVADYERRLGAARGRTSFLAVLVRYGLGAVMFGNGAFLVGDESFTCEFGHMRISAGGPACACGSRGCLDVVASGRTLPAPGRRKGPDWERELARRVRALATGIANLLKVFHPPLVILDGVYNDHESFVRPRLVKALETELSGVALSVPEVAFGARAQFKASLGAALRAGDAFLAEHLLHHLFRSSRNPSARTGKRGR